MKKRSVLLTVLLMVVTLLLVQPVQAQSASWGTAFGKVTGIDDTEVEYFGTATIISTGTAYSTAFDIVGTDRILETFIDTKLIADTGAVTTKLQYYDNTFQEWKDLVTVSTIAEKLDSTFVSAIDTSQYASNDLKYRYALTGGAANDTITVDLKAILKKKGFR